jgi:Fe-Mn family superoxide dismutase
MSQIENITNNTVFQKNSNSFVLMNLPYADSALEPCISAETIKFHYGKHHTAYVNNLNNLLKDNVDFTGSEDLIEIIKKAVQCGNKKVFNNAAQIWNHDFFWNGLTPEQSFNQPSNDLLNAINNSFGDFDKFLQEFKAVSLAHFASGWTWLVYDKSEENANKQLKLITTGNADIPHITNNEHTPLWTCDLWEHSYYVDYRNDRGSYLDKIAKITNWNFINNNFHNSFKS